MSVLVHVITQFFIFILPKVDNVCNYGDTVPSLDTMDSPIDCISLAAVGISLSVFLSASKHPICSHSSFTGYVTLHHKPVTKLIILWLLQYTTASTTAIYIYVHACRYLCMIFRSQSVSAVLIDSHKLLQASSPPAPGALSNLWAGDGV